MRPLAPIAALRAPLRRRREARDLLEVFAHAPVGIALLDDDLRIVRVNDRLAALAGRPAMRLAGRPVRDLLPALAEDAARVVRTGTPLGDTEVRTSTGVWLASYWPLHRGGVGIVLTDITERRAAERALRAQTDRYEALLIALSDAGEGLVVLDREGRCLYANPAFEQLSGHTFPELAAMDTLLDLVVEYDDESLRRRVLRRIEHGSVTPQLPLTLRRRDGAWVDVEVAGTPLVVESGPQLVLVVRDVTARRRAEAERERLYEERDQVARTLQAALLPPELPRVPGVELAGRYVPAGEVGGDFYDCFATGGGDWALVIGDVCGKGAEAASLTALARYTLRAAAQHTRAPRAVLRVLNEALLRQRLDYRFCTVLYASVTPRDGRVSVCLAAGGHPLPFLLRAGGGVEAVGTPGMLLGIVDDPDVTERAVELAPGDALVLFTDGVTEATADDRAAGPRRLEALLGRCAGQGAAAIAEAVERDAVAAQGGRLRDDVAVLVARSRLPPTGEG